MKDYLNNSLILEALEDKDFCAMFSGFPELVSCPELPASITVPADCYAKLFEGCKPNPSL